MMSSSIVVDIAKAYYKVIYDGAYSNILIENYSNSGRAFFSYGLLNSIRYSLAIENFLDKEKIVLKSKFKNLNLKIKSVVIVGATLLLLSNKKDYAIVNDLVDYVKNSNSNYVGFVNGVLRNFSRQLTKFKLDYTLYIDTLPIFSILKGYIDKDRLLKIVKIYLSPNSIKSGGYFNDFRKKYMGILSQDGYFFLDDFANKGSFDNDLLSKEGFIFQDYSNYKLMKYFLRYYKSDKKELDTLELASYPGGKSFFITGKNVIHNDILDWKVQKLKDRVGGDATYTCFDASSIPSQYSNFNYIFADVPCSASGIIKRRPEIAYKITKKGVKESAKLQRKILNSSANRLKKGGYIFYSTCSFFREENSEQIKIFLNSNKNFILEDMDYYNSEKFFDSNDMIFGAILKKIGD